MEKSDGEAEKVRSLLDDLLEKSRLYKDSNDYKKLLDFVVRLRNFAPFNGMLLQVQKPGLKLVRFGRELRVSSGAADSQPYASAIPTRLSALRIA